MIFKCEKPTALKDIALRIIDFGKKYAIWLFEGKMGAGKTTFIKYICYAMGVVDNVSSPTFSIINEYKTVNNQNLYHFDFYRINNELEAIETGCEEYFFSGNHCFIEWHTKVLNLLPSKYLYINISFISEKSRNIEVTTQG